MSAFESLALALRGHFHKLFAQLPPDIQQRVQVDFAPWSWDGKNPRQRCQRAKQWDYENDPALRERREGNEALTNPNSPSYSLEETQRLRGDFLPEARNVQRRVDLPPLELGDIEAYPLPKNLSSVVATVRAGSTHRAGSAAVEKINDGVPLELVKVDAPNTEMPHEKNKRRWQMCSDAGLTMPDTDYEPLPKGVGILAKREGISTQAFSKSVKKHLARGR